MTAEIAIINRHALALAADSAVTVGREKVWKTANKLFSLGPAHDIAIMIYGSGDYLSFPWEVVIKEFRKRSESQTFNTVRDCANEFRTFLLSSTFGAEGAQNLSIMFPLFDVLKQISDLTENEDGEHSEADVAAAIAERLTEIGNAPIIFDDLTLEVFADKYRGKVERYASSFFEEAIALAHVDDFLEILFELSRRKVESDYASGVVVAGFGSQEYFPCLLHFSIDGRFEITVEDQTTSYIRWWEESDSADLNNPAANPFPIIPFAQQDMTFLFTTGIAPRHLNYLSELLVHVLRGALNEMINQHVAPADQEQAAETAELISTETTSAFMDDFRSYLREKLIEPVKTAVSALPKEEMAAMAEALVDLTSLRRKVDSKLETVGGPVDVAVISKGDGFVWIKRKHYFNPELNGDFFRRRSRHLGGQQ